MTKRGSSRDDAALPVRAIPVRAAQAHAVRTRRDRVDGIEPATAAEAGSPRPARTSRTAALDERRMADAVLGSSGLLVVVLDLESRIVRGNRAYCDFAGVSEDAVVGQPFPTHPAAAAVGDAQHAAYAAWFAGVAQGRDRTVWEQVLRPDAAVPRRVTRRIDWRGSRMPEAEGQPDHLLLVGVDVTEQRRIEDEARQRRADTAHRHRLHLAHELAAAFGHELSQPLAAMVAFADVAVQRHARAGIAAKNDDSAVEFEEIALQARRAAHTLLELRRFAAKGESEPARECGLNALARSACGLLHDDAQVGGVVLECELARAEVPVLAEAVRLEHALVNLIRNAIESAAQRAGDSGGGVVRIVVRPLDDGATVRVSVLDNGSGIAPDQVERIFKPFYTTRAHGLGLGLRMARTVVEAHRGRLWAEASPHGGIFHCTLPILGAGAASSEVAR